MLHVQHRCTCVCASAKNKEINFFLVMATARQGLLKLLSSEAKLTRENVLEYARDNHMGKQTLVRVLEDLTQDQTLDFSGLKKASVSDLCSLLHQHSRGSHNRRTDDDVTMDLDSDNLDEQQDECIDEGDSEMARGSAKARSLSRAAIAEADHQVCTLLSATFLRARTLERLFVAHNPNERRPKLPRPTCTRCGAQQSAARCDIDPSQHSPSERSPRTNLIGARPK